MRNEKRKGPRLFWTKKTAKLEVTYSLARCDNTEIDVTYGTPVKALALVFFSVYISVPFTGLIDPSSEMEMVLLVFLAFRRRSTLLYRGIRIRGVRGVR